MSVKLQPNGDPTANLPTLRPSQPAFESHVLAELDRSSPAPNVHDLGVASPVHGRRTVPALP